VPTARFQSLKHTDVPSEIRELQRSKQSFSALAENEDWLANNFDKIIHSQRPISREELWNSRGQAWRLS
jgi:hypothetical protein